MEGIDAFHQLHDKKGLIFLDALYLLLLVPQLCEEIATVSLVESLVDDNSSVFSSSKKPLHEDGLVGRRHEALP